MQPQFEELISGFLEKRVGIANEFLSPDLASHLKSNLVTLYENEALELAGIGNAHLLNHDNTIRRDKIFWLDRQNNNPHENQFLDMIDSFISYLNRTCYTGIKSCEFHYALYEEGAFYKRHIDQFKSDDSRAFSMIMYLNESWKHQDGGELKIYQGTGIQTISPQNKKCVFFKSNELEHEVAVTHATRMSVTGWLRTSL